MRISMFHVETPVNFTLFILCIEMCRYYADHYLYQIDTLLLTQFNRDDMTDIICDKKNCQQDYENDMSY